MHSSTMKLALPLAITLLALACAPRSTPTPPPDVRGDVLAATEVEALSAAYLAAGAAFGRSDFVAVATAFADGARINPGDDSLVYQQAAALALAGRHEEALVLLERMAAQGSALVPQARDFPGLAGERFAAIVSTTQAKIPGSRSALAFMLAERDLIPEGITLDPAHRTFFVGSIYRRKIVAIGPDGAARDLVASAADELYSPLGMRFDATRGSLWVASSALSTMQGFDRTTHTGRAALHEYDAATGRLRARYPRDSQQPHLLNDLVLGPRGELYVTDSEAGEVLQLTPGPGAEFEVLVPAGELHYPNGVALSDDASTLFVADFVHGLTAIHLADRRRTTLPHPRGASTRGIDGLYFHRGGLLGVQNGAGAGRIVRFELAPALDRVLGVEVLEAGHPSFEIPTTGTLDGDALVYIANSQLRSFDGDKIFPAERLRPVSLLRLPLP
jgi:sugar lactone lactonase YvrE